MSFRVSPAKLAAAFDRLARDRNHTILVADIAGKIVGTCHVIVVPHLGHALKPFAIVENVVVDADARSSGIGQHLMAAAGALARRSGCYKLALTSNIARPRAHKFYERLGWTRTHFGYSIPTKLPTWGAAFGIETALVWFVLATIRLPGREDYDISGLSNLRVKVANKIIAGFLAFGFRFEAGPNQELTFQGSYARRAALRSGLAEAVDEQRPTHKCERNYVANFHSRDISERNGRDVSSANPLGLAEPHRLR
jgi:GNAT superfamily N-acetyltransferase